MQLKEAKLQSLQHPIIVYDGQCILCNGFVQWLIRKDRNEIFRYTTLQSSGNISSAIKGDTVILLDKEKVFTHSDVALKALPKLGGTWKVVQLLNIIPSQIRNKVYNFIAHNRYRWFGKSETCLLPDPKKQHLFLD